MKFMTIAQEKALNKLATIHANEMSKDKGKFPKRRFKPKDILKMIQNKDKVQPTLASLIKTSKIIKKHEIGKNYKTIFTQEEFDSLNKFILSDLNMDSWGIAYFNGNEIYQGMGIPYKNVIVLIRHMEKDKFDTKTLPNMDCMIEVMKVYGDTGVAALEVTNFLRNMGVGAIPNHSLGGNIDYTKAAYKANLGFVGKHGMLITPHIGSCCRISVVYTSIENMDSFLDNNEDFSWGENFCSKCKKCVRSCPYQAIYPKNKVDCYNNIESISYQKCGSGFAKYGCGICIASCPFTSQGYEKIKSLCNNIK